MSDDAPNGRELRELLIRMREDINHLTGRVTGIEKSRGRIVAWFASVAVIVVAAVIISYLR